MISDRDDVGIAIGDPTTGVRDHQRTVTLPQDAGIARVTFAGDCLTRLRMLSLGISQGRRSEFCRQANLDLASLVPSCLGISVSVVR